MSPKRLCVTGPATLDTAEVTLGVTLHKEPKVEEALCPNRDSIFSHSKVLKHHLTVLQNTGVWHSINHSVNCLHISNGYTENSPTGNL